ncbi:glycosyltransferase family 4 protein [soil metagenome]
MHKIIRITTVPLSLEKLLEGQLSYMNQFFEITAISADEERLRKYGKNNGVKTFCVNLTREITPIKDTQAVLSLYKFLKKENPLIVHTHTPKAGIVGMLAAKMAGVPIRLHTVAGLPLLETTGNKRRLLNFVEKLTYSLSTRIYPNSQGLKNIILNQNFAPVSKMKVLGKGSSNGIDTNYFDPENFSEEERINILQNLGIPLDDLIFIFIGRLVSEKGINELVAAFSELKRNNNNISLLLIGPFEQDLDPLEKNTLNTIKEDSKIYTTGYQVDVRPYLAIADVLTFPSYREGFPNVVMQACAMGLPAIVSNINGCNEIIIEGKNGIIIPVKNKLALQDAMHYMVQNPDMRRKYASNSRFEICKNYERKEFWRILQVEYESLINQAGFNR